MTTAHPAEMRLTDEETAPCRAACHWTWRSAETTAASTPWPVCGRSWCSNRNGDDARTLRSQRLKHADQWQPMLELSQP